MQCRCRGNAVQGYSEEGECCVGFHSCAAGCGLSGQNPAHRGLSSVLQYDDRDEVWDLLNCYAGEWPRPTAWPRASKKKEIERQRLTLRLLSLRLLSLRLLSLRLLSFVCCPPFCCCCLSVSPTTASPDTRIPREMKMNPVCLMHFHRWGSKARDRPGGERSRARLRQDPVTERKRRLRLCF